ncbi:unnamed protein product, partial [marine sediment metagenome]
REGVQHDSETKFEEEYAEQIKQLVKGLEYSDKVAQDFVNMANGWKDERGQLVLVVWKKKLAQTKDEHKQGKISKDQLAEVEQSIAKELSQRIKKEIGVNDFSDLAEVIKNGRANCGGYSQLIYILSDSIGLSIQAINVVELKSGLLLGRRNHVVCLVRLANGRIMMVDLVPAGFVSKPFIIEKAFTKAGNYWELKDKANPLGIHKRIQMLNRNGLIAVIYNDRGSANSDIGQLSQAISNYTRAIELNPTYAEVYSNRGNTYCDLGQYIQAISDLNKAIELNPRYAEAYCNRGTAYYGLGQANKAISDLTKAIELKTIAVAYYNRGAIYYNLGQYHQAIPDLTKAIELGPELIMAYYIRGGAYHMLRQYPKAISDYTKAIELNPKFAQAYYSRGCAYALLGKLEESKKDLLKAVKLNPALKPFVKEESDYFKLNLKLE